MGRALCQQLSAAGVHVALCDVSAAAMAETQALCRAQAPAGTRVTTCVADVSQEAQVLAFRDAVINEHQTPHIHLLFNNAGIGGGGGFVSGDRADWERTFNIDWFGVYYGARAFLPLLVAGPGGCIVNVSSVNGFWASLGPGVAHTAYSAAKFAVKGFTEALITDLRTHAPHVRCAVVMPGHIGTSIALNTYDVMKLTAAQLAVTRARMLKAGAPVADLPDEAIRQLLLQRSHAAARLGAHPRRHRGDGRRVRQLDVDPDHQPAAERRAGPAPDRRPPGRPRWADRNPPDDVPGAQL